MSRCLVSFCIQLLVNILGYIIYNVVLGAVYNAARSPHMSAAAKHLRNLRDIDSPVTAKAYLVLQRCKFIHENSTVDSLCEKELVDYTVKVIALSPVKFHALL